MPRDEALIKKAFSFCEKQLGLINGDRERFTKVTGGEMAAPLTGRAIINSRETCHVLAIMASLAMDKPVPATVWDHIREESDD